MNLTLELTLALNLILLFVCKQIRVCKKVTDYTDCSRAKHSITKRVFMSMSDWNVVETSTKGPAWNNSKSLPVILSHWKPSKVISSIATAPSNSLDPNSTQILSVSHFLPHTIMKVNHLILHYLDLCVVCFLKAIKSLLSLLVWSK